MSGKRYRVSVDLCCSDVDGFSELLRVLEAHISESKMKSSKYSIIRVCGDCVCEIVEVKA